MLSVWIRRLTACLVCYCCGRTSFLRIGKQSREIRCGHQKRLHVGSYRVLTSKVVVRLLAVLDYLSLTNFCSSQYSQIYFNNRNFSIYSIMCTCTYTCGYHRGVKRDILHVGESRSGQAPQCLEFTTHKQYS